MRLLVTGAAGFIGSNFVRYWAATHPQDTLVGYDVLTYAACESSLDDMRDRLTFVHGDIGDQAGVQELLAAHDLAWIHRFLVDLLVAAV